jgi:hypothetical protein
MPSLNRRSFMKLGAILVPAVAAPTVAYSFLWSKPEPRVTVTGNHYTFKAKCGARSVTVNPSPGTTTFYHIKKIGENEWQMVAWERDGKVHVVDQCVEKIGDGVIVLNRDPSKGQPAFAVSG